MNRTVLVFCLSVLLLFTSQAYARSLLCLIQPEREAEIGSPVVGVVESIRVERGDIVKKGQVLARLRSHVEAASLRVARARAQADADVRAAQANYEYMKQQQRRSEELFQKNFISAQALEKSSAEAKLAAEKLAQAQEQRDVLNREVELAQAQLELRAIRAPFSGVIVDRYVSVGERIEDKPMFRISRVNPLRVEVVVPAAMFGTIESGMIAKVTPDLPNMDSVDAKVVLVDNFVDAASNTFRVRALLENEDGRIPAGLRCTATLLDAPTPGEQEPSPTASDEKPLKKPAAAPSSATPVNKLQVKLDLEAILI